MTMGCCAPTGPAARKSATSNSRNPSPLRSFISSPGELCLRLADQVLGNDEYRAPRSRSVGGRNLLHTDIGNEDLDREVENSRPREGRPGDTERRGRRNADLRGIVRPGEYHGRCEVRGAAKVLEQRQ